MYFSIVFDDSKVGVLSRTEIDSFVFTSNIYKLYSIAKIHARDICKQLYNYIKTGMTATIKFYDDNKVYKNSMSVLSFTKVPGPQLGDYLEITFVSSLYFKNADRTAAYSGNVGQIVNQIITEQFPEIKKFSCSSTEDISRYRYQVAEDSQAFMTRILKYGVIQNKPVYLYTDPQGSLNLKGVADLIKEEPKYLARPILNEYENVKSDADDTTIPLAMVSYQFNTNGRDAVSKIESVFSTVLFKSSTAQVNSLTSLSPENNNAQCDTETPHKIELYGWHMTPDDAMNIAIKSNYEETCDTYTLVSSFNSFLVDELNVGNTLYVLLPYNPTVKSSTGASVNCGEGKYIVSGVKYIYENEVLRTVATLQQVGY